MNHSSFYCHSKERETERQKRLEEVLEELENRIQFNIPDVDLIKDQITGKFLCSNRIRKFQRKQRKQRKIAIIRKLLKEYDRQKQIDEAANKRYDYKVRKKEKVIRDMGVVGLGIPFPKESRDEIQDTEEEEEEETIAESPVVVKEKKGKKEKKVKEGKRKKAKEKKPKDKKAKSDEAQKFKLPEIPILNERNKVIASESLKMSDLIRDLPELERIEQEKISYKKTLTKNYRPTAAEDTITIVNPKELCFKVRFTTLFYR